MDFQNQKDVLICDRAECNHDKESCAAYFDGMVYPILEEDRIIYISDYEAQQVGQWGVYSCDVNGENRKLEIDLGECDIQMINYIIWKDSKIYLEYYNQYDENYMDLDENVTGIACVDRENETVSILYESKESQGDIGTVWLTDSGIYFSLTFNDNPSNAIDDFFNNEDRTVEDYEKIIDNIHGDICMLKADGKVEKILTDLKNPGDFYTTTEGELYYIVDGNKLLNQKGDVLMESSSLMFGNYYGGDRIYIRDIKEDTTLWNELDGESGKSLSRVEFPENEYMVSGVTGDMVYGLKLLDDGETAFGFWDIEDWKNGDADSFKIVQGQGL